MRWTNPVPVSSAGVEVLFPEMTVSWVLAEPIRLGENSTDTVQEARAASRSGQVPSAYEKPVSSGISTESMAMARSLGLVTVKSSTWASAPG